MVCQAVAVIEIVESIRFGRRSCALRRECRRVIGTLMEGRWVWASGTSSVLVGGLAAVEPPDDDVVAVQAAM